jgi:hypothetical protein
VHSCCRAGRRLVDELLAAGIEPFVTSTTGPAASAAGPVRRLQSADTAKAFADYAGEMSGIGPSYSPLVGHLRLARHWAVGAVATR